MVQLLEDLNLADGCDRELAPDSKEVRVANQYEFQNAIHGSRKGNTYALSLVVHADLLERHDFLRLLLLRHEHLPGNNHKKNASARERPGWAGAQAP